MRDRMVWRKFWRVAGAVPIRVKIMGVVIAMTVTLGVAVTVIVYHGLSTTLEHELDERGLAIATNLAHQSQELVLTDRLFTLYTVAKDTVRDHQDLLYVYITDRDGTVLVHTFVGGIPQDFVDRVLLDVRAPVIRRFGSDAGLIRSISVPILGGRAGVVHLGMSENDLTATIRRYIWRIVAATSAVVIVGTAAAFAVAGVLARPIRELANAAEAVGRGDFTWRAPAWARDELGRLGASFARMAERLSRMRDELTRRDEARRRLLEKVITAQEDERRRIARELHDETSQSLTSLAVGLATIGAIDDVGRARARAGELRALAVRTLEEVHNLSRGLRPSVLDDLGLVPALERHLKEYGAAHGIGVDVAVAGLDGERLPGPVETAVYRIVQEALTNAAKHGAPLTVSVVVERRGDRLLVIVEDDGRGFDVEALEADVNTDACLGVHGMRERAALLGGTLTIESAAGRGTTVFADVPLDVRVEG